MKNLLLSGLMIVFLFAACKDGEKETKTTEADTVADTETVVEKVATCETKTADKAAMCLCELFDKRDNSDLMNDEYNELQSRINEVNDLIDVAIEAGNYTEEDLNKAAENIDCRF